MANEIILTSSLRSTLSGTTVINATTSKTQSAAVAATNVYHATQEITARTAVGVGSLDITLATGDSYMVLLYNRSASGYITVEFEYTTSTYAVVGLIYPGECWGPVRMPKMTHADYGNLHITPSTGTMYVEIVATEAGTPP